jgi:CPA2 family monovalent cation:H+ antiporter-2
VAAALAQVGEFSLVLAEQGIALGLLPVEGRDLALSAVLFSIALNPLAFVFARWMAGRGTSVVLVTEQRPPAPSSATASSADKVSTSSR